MGSGLCSVPNEMDLEVLFRCTSHSVMLPALLFDFSSLSRCQGQTCVHVMRKLRTKV